MSKTYGYAIDPSFKGLLTSVGVSHADVLRRAGLSEDFLDQPNARVSAEQFFAFGHAIQEVADDPLLPIRMARGMRAELFSPPLFAALCSPNLIQAVERLAKFKLLLAPVRLRPKMSAAGFQVTYDWAEQPMEPPAFLIGGEALILMKLARIGTGREVRAVDVTLPVLPPAQDAYEAFFGCRLRRDAQARITFRAEDAERPFMTDNCAMWAIFEPQLRKRLEDLEASASFTKRTRALLLEALPSGQASVDVVAQRLAVSSRTLQRRLRAEGTSFKAIVNATRKSLSLYYLKQTHLTYGEIAFLVGFEEPNSFFRAFRAWTGTTPDALRQSLASEG